MKGIGECGAQVLLSVRVLMSRATMYVIERNLGPLPTIPIIFGDDVMPKLRAREDIETINSSGHVNRLRRLAPDTGGLMFIARLKMANKKPLEWRIVNRQH